MASINKVILVGYVGKDPEIRVSQDGKNIANFSLATTENYKKKNGEKDSKTEWHKIVVYGDSLASMISNYVKKGTLLYIEGSLETKKWQDKNGVEKYTTSVIIKGYNSKLTILQNPVTADNF